MPPGYSGPVKIDLPRLRPILLALWLLVGLACLLVLVARRHGEAKEVAEANLVARDLAGRVRYEALRQPRESLHALAARAPAAMAFSAEELVERARPLAAAGFVISVEHPRAGLVAAAPPPASVPPVGPNVLTVGSARYLAGAGPNNIPGDAFLFPAALQDRAAVGKVLGMPYASKIHAAIVVDRAALEHVARGVLQPGVELAVYHAGVRQVQLVRGAGTDLALDIARERAPADVMQAEVVSVDLSRAIDWPGFLLAGGDEIGGVEFRAEERRGRPYQVAYVRDFRSDSDAWSGIALAYAEIGPRRAPWPAALVIAGLCGYLLLGALVLHCTRWPTGRLIG